MNLFYFLFLFGHVSSGKEMEFWLTDPDKNIHFQQQTSLYPKNIRENINQNQIQINSSEKYQTIEGFGFALTGGSALNLYQLNNETRLSILNELFRTDENNIGVSYLRLSIGSSDLNDFVFSYDDLNPGETDINMTHFSLNQDQKYLIPLLKEILLINPEIKILGSPWSAPTWMKTNGKTIGGHLLSDYENAYALYFVRYIQCMKTEGIHINAITIQNEPLYGGNNPSMVMFAEQQTSFIKNHLGPMFRKYSIETKIWIYDHNPDRPDYPLTILADQQARSFIDGSAFHMYAGRIEVLSLVHDIHPDKNIYFTEQWVEAPGNLKADLAWHLKTLIIGATRNWARTIIEWNLASDSKWEPHTKGGCDNCLGALTIDQNQIKSPRNPSYYIIAHASKFVRPGSFRISSNMISNLPNVAFQRSIDQKYVLIVFNDEKDEEITFEILSDGEIYQATLSAGSVGTFFW